MPVRRRAEPRARLSFPRRRTIQVDLLGGERARVRVEADDQQTVAWLADRVAELLIEEPRRPARGLRLTFAEERGEAAPAGRR